MNFRNQPGECAHHYDKSRRAAERQAGAFLSVMDEVDAGVRNGFPADAALSGIFRKNRNFGSRDRRFISNTVFSYYRWKGWVETSERRLINGNKTQSPFAASGVFAHLLDDNRIIPPITSLAKIAGISDERLIPLGDLTLNEKTRAISDIIDPHSSFYTEHLIPAWAWNHLATTGDPGFAARLVEAFQSRPPVWIRARKDEREQVIHLLANQGHDAQAHPVLSEAISVGASISRSLARSSKRPFIEIQDIASQCVGRICDPEPGHGWWDVCAGSGGKSLHLAEIMNNEGSILATDIRNGPLKELQTRSNRIGANMIRPLKIHEAGPLPFDTCFDGILIDAPCSGTGTWSRNPDARWRTSEEAVEQLSSTQSGLLRRAVKHVKPGGTLVYAVCSLTRKETTDTAGTFLEEHPEFEPLPFTNPLTGNQTDGSLLILPWKGPCDGMFIARFKRSTS